MPGELQLKTVARDLFTAKSLYDKARTALFAYVVLHYLLKANRHLWARGIRTTAHELYVWITQQLVFLYLRLPSAKAVKESKMAAAKLMIENRLVPKGADVVRHLALPEEGKPLEWILAEMDKMDKEKEHSDWKLGKISGAIYHGGEEMEKVIVAAYQKYCVSNPLHPDVFPAIRKMEAEVVAMCLKMYNAPPEGAGAMTSGGTESIVMALKTYRDWARDVKGITEPEIVIPSSAHAAFDKGAAYFNIKVHQIPVDSYTRKGDLKRIKRAINSNTILLVGSCINFPDGNQDDIVALGALAAARRIGLHVDCCLGSFIVPFLEPAGLSAGNNGKYKLYPFDFRVKGVTSISCDTHKYGFAPKGTSVVMYRDAELRRYQYYVNPTWSGGVYASPSLSGSRPGALIAGAWAAMQYMGSNGYLESCRSIVTCARTIADAISTSIPELYVLGNPPASVVAFASKHPLVNVHRVGDAMSSRGWHLNGLSDPPALHIACTRLTVQMTDNFIADLKDSVKEAKLGGGEDGTMVTLYGLGKSSSIGPSLVGELATAFLDALYKA